MAKKIFLYGFVLFITLAQASCGMKKMATHVMGKIATDGMVAVEGEEDVAFARESSPALIKTLEVLHYGNPKDKTSLVLLSKAYGQYAFGFAEEEILEARANDQALAGAKAQAERFYGRGKDYGISALSQKCGMKKAFISPIDDFKKALHSLGRKDVPMLFWAAFNWANWLNLHLDDPQAIADLPRIQAIVDRAIELDPKFYFASSHVIRGVIAASRPKMFGGDLELSNREFKEAINLSPNYLMTKVMYAQYYARQARDVDLFKSTLNDVMKDESKSDPNARLANELAKRRAKILLDRVKELF